MKRILPLIALCFGLAAIILGIWETRIPAAIPIAMGIMMIVLGIKALHDGRKSK